MRIDAVVTQPEFIDQVRGKQVGFTQRHTAIRIVLDAVKETTPVEDIIKGGGDVAGLVLVAEAREKVVFLREFVVHSHIEVVARFLSRGLGQEVCPRNTSVGHRQKGGQARRKRIDVAEDIQVSARRNRYAAEAIGVEARLHRLPRVENFSDKCCISAAVQGYGPIDWSPRVRVELRRKIAQKIGAEVACDFLGRGNNLQDGRCLPDPQTLVIEEEKRPILDNRSTQRESELILLVRLASELVKGISGIKLLIAQKLVNVAMQLIGARLNDGIHDGAIAATELSAVCVGLHLKLCNCIYGRLNHVRGFVEQVAEIGIVVNAVEQKIVLQRACTVRTEAESFLRA